MCSKHSKTKKTSLKSFFKFSFKSSTKNDINIKNIIPQMKMFQTKDTNLTNY